ncbi:MAG: hypothetical protein PHR66_10800, partial [Desulfuromonadaceae bacterium]|nr:hypothetical protein [Desulfuromonadaceae bacterium]
TSERSITPGIANSASFARIDATNFSASSRDSLSAAYLRSMTHGYYRAIIPEGECMHGKPNSDHRINLSAK